MLIEQAEVAAVRSHCDLYHAVSPEELSLDHAGVDPFDAGHD